MPYATPQPGPWDHMQPIGDEDLEERWGGAEFHDIATPRMWATPQKSPLLSPGLPPGLAQTRQAQLLVAAAAGAEIRAQVSPIDLRVAELEAQMREHHALIKNSNSSVTEHHIHNHINTSHSAILSGIDDLRELAAKHPASKKIEIGSFEPGSNSSEC